MKELYLPILLASCALLFSGCANQEQTEDVKEDITEQKGKLAQTTSNQTQNFSPPTTHEHDPAEKCSYPTDAFSACTGKTDNNPCEYEQNGKNISGKCATEPCGKVVCKTAE